MNIELGNGDMLITVQCIARILGGLHKLTSGVPVAIDGKLVLDLKRYNFFMSSFNFSMLLSLKHDVMYAYLKREKLYRNFIWRSIDM